MHLLDLTVILLYFVGLMIIGYVMAKRIKNESDYLVGGRKLGRLLQVFMNFGMATSVDAPIGSSREAYRQGVSGIWIQLYLLFTTPFYWITTVWQRRLRLSSMSEFYRVRYDSPAMEKLYSLVGILFLTAVISVGMVSLQKTIESIMPKPAYKLTMEEKAMIDNFHTLQELEIKQQSVSLTEVETRQLETLKDLKVQGQVRSNFPAIHPVLLLVLVSVVLLFYTLAGGIHAAAVTDLFQGFLLIVLSILLLPFALNKTGWFTGLHERVPDVYFNLFGSGVANEYPWYYVAILVCVGLLITESSPHNMQVMGSAKDEEAARVGRISGNYMKRVVVVLWGFTGIVGYALYKNQLSDPDMLWGHMTRQLLGPGFIGLMVVCMLAALQSTASAMMVATGAIFVKSFYQPLVPDKSEKHYVFVSRLSSAIVLILAVLITLYFNDFLRILRLTWSIGLTFGPLFWLGIMWRKVTKKAAWIAMIYSLVLTLFFGQFSSGIKPLSKVEYLCQTTEQGTSIFFEEVVSEQTDEGTVVQVGKNRLRTSLIVPALVGCNFSNMSKADINTIGYALDILVPFLLMFLFSLCTQPVSAQVLDQFYGRMHTPVHGSAEDDEREMALTMKDPLRFRQNKLFPNSSIELLKPTKRDILGFLICWGMVAAIILFLLLLINLGK